MKESSLKCIVALSGLLVTLFCSQSIATTLDPATLFTLRSDTNAGPATSMSTGDGGFTGFLSNFEIITFGTVDRTYLEFDMSGFGGGPVTIATLDFAMSGQVTPPVDTISMGWYVANGVAELGDWYTSQDPFTTFDSDEAIYSIDITDLINSNLGSLSYIGFGFSIDEEPNQAFFDTTSVSINYLSTVVVPIPAAAWLFGSGLLGLVGVARRKQTT